MAEHSVRCVRELIDRDFYGLTAHTLDANGDAHLPQEDEWNLLAWTLLHDATEAYLSDIARPVKQGLGFGEVYREAEDRLMKVIAERYGLMGTMPEAVKRVDDTLLRTEQRDLMPLGNHPGDEYAIDPIRETWTPKEARDAFLSLADELII